MFKRAKGFIGGLLGVMAGSGRGGLGPWRTLTSLPSDFTATRMVPLPQGDVVLFGRGGPTFGIDSWVSLILRVEEERARPVWSGHKGWIEAADGRDDELWALQARKLPDRDGSEYFLLESRDAGRSWRDRGRIPARSLTQIALEGDGRGWALGVDELLRTVDGGASWQPVEAPGRREGVAEPIVALGPNRAVLGGRSLLRTEDGGGSWETLCEGDFPATDGRYVVGTGEGGLRIGRIDGGGVVWVGRYPGELFPDLVVSRGDWVRIRSAGLGDRAGTGVYLLDGTDGRSFVEHRIAGSSDTATIGLSPEGHVWQVTIRRDLRVSAPPPS